MTERNAPNPMLHTSDITEWTRCPQCGAVAEIRQRYVLQSTAGPLEHVDIVCVERHTFLCPAAMLEETPVSTPSVYGPTRRPASATGAYYRRSTDMRPRFDRGRFA